jgi:hypothetical protein
MQTQTYGGVALKFQAFLVSIVDWSEWSASRSCRFTPGLRQEARWAPEPVCALWPASAGDKSKLNSPDNCNCRPRNLLSSFGDKTYRRNDLSTCATFYWSISFCPSLSDIFSQYDVRKFSYHLKTSVRDIMYFCFIFVECPHIYGNIF